MMCSRPARNPTTKTRSKHVSGYATTTPGALSLATRESGGAAGALPRKASVGGAERAARRVRPTRLAASGRPGAPAAVGGAFTLIEMLLALVIVTLLLGAILFNFTTLARGAELDEGVRRIKTALTMARAHAANTQQPVRLIFEQDEESPFTDPVYRIRFAAKPVGGEDDAEGGGGGGGNGASPGRPDLFGQSSADADEGASAGADADPDTFAGGYRQIRSLVTPQAQANEVIAVTEVRPLDRAGNVFEEEDLEFAAADDPPPIEFYPDGSSESAEIVIRSRDAEDERRMRIRIVGMTGRITSTQLFEDEQETDGETEGEPADVDADADAAQDAESDLNDPGYRIDR